MFIQEIQISSQRKIHKSFAKQFIEIPLNNFTVRICRSFHNLKKEDLCYLCLILLRLDNYQISQLLNKNRKTIWDRMKKIKERMNLDEDTNIHDVLSKFI